MEGKTVVDARGRAPMVLRVLRREVGSVSDPCNEQRTLHRYGRGSITTFSVLDPPWSLG